MMTTTTLLACGALVAGIAPAASAAAFATLGAARLGFAQATSSTLATTAPIFSIGASFANPRYVRVKTVPCHVSRKRGHRCGSVSGPEIVARRRSVKLMIRRLAAALAVAFASGCSAPFSQTPAGASIAPGVVRRAASSNPIKHIVIIVQENRSFDNLFQ